MADGDHLVARPDADGFQRQMKGRGAVGYGTSVGRADQLREFALEGGDFGTLSHPAGQHDAAHGVHFTLVEDGFCDRDLSSCVRHSAASAVTARS